MPVENGTVYLDHSATTPVDPRVVAVMLPYFTEVYGNPSSIHSPGQKAAQALDQARREVARVLGCSPNEIIFTGCGTESDNLSLRGALMSARQTGRRHLITTPIEHHAIGLTAGQLADYYETDVTLVPVDHYGQVDPDDVRQAIRPDTALVSVMYANNEVGTIQPLAEIGRICREHDVLFHSDAIQAGGSLDLNVEHLQVDLMSLSGHKFYGPKGVGVLYVRRGTPLLPTQTGGGHERGLRAGTQNVPYIVGLATALRLAHEEREARNTHARELRDRLIEGIPNNVPDCQLTGHPVERLPGHASFVIRGVQGQEMLMYLDMAGFAASSGSACNTGDPEPSEVLLAMGFPPEWALGSLRLTVGQQNTLDEMDRLIAALPDIVSRMRAMGEPMELVS